MGERVPLDIGFSTTLDGSGNGTVVIGPTNSLQTWYPNRISVNVTTNVSEPVFKYYRGRTAGTVNYIDGTYTGSNDSSEVLGVVLHPGEVLLCSWTQGDAGATATVTLGGEMEYQ